MRRAVLSRTPWERARERLLALLFAACAYLSILVLFGIIYVLVRDAIPFFREVGLRRFLLDTQWTPLFAEKHFGIWPLLMGTFLTSGLALLVALPTGLIIALYLSEFANPRLRQILKPLLELLAAVPTVVYGYFALLVVTPFLQRLLPGLSTFNALSAGFVMGVMILPLMSSLSEDALRAVPRSLREASLALGASRLVTAIRVVLPAAASGVGSAAILALSRAIGETMIVTIAAGQQPRFSLNPLGPVQTVTAYIVQVSLGDAPHGTLEYYTIYAAGFTLFLMTLLANLVAYWLKRKFRERYI